LDLHLQNRIWPFLFLIQTLSGSWCGASGPKPGPGSAFHGG